MSSKKIVVLATNGRCFLIRDASFATRVFIRRISETTPRAPTLPSKKMDWCVPTVPVSTVLSDTEPLTYDTVTCCDYFLQ